MSAPLAGCRIIDFGIITAGAATTALLADLGAEVIKVESPNYRDPFRAWPTDDTAGSPFFRSNNRGKRAISVNLKHSEGQAVLLRLAARSDVVLENFSRGVLDRLGLGVGALRTVNPRLILLAISSQGVSGPDAGQISFGSTLEAVAGLAWMTGYADGPPCVSGRELNYPDQVVALFAAGAALAAWHARARHGQGAVLDVCQRELTSYMLGEAFLAAGEAGAAARQGNADPQMAVQRCFRAADGRWLAVTIPHGPCAALDRLLGPADTPLDARLAAWVQTGAAEERATALAWAGIAAAPALNGHEIGLDVACRRSDALRPTAGGGLEKGMPFHLDTHDAAVTGQAPAIGADTEAVLRDLLDYDTAAIADLAARGIIECASQAPRSP